MNRHRHQQQQQQLRQPDHKLGFRIQSVMLRAVLPFLFLCNLFVVYSNLHWVLEKSEVIPAIEEEFLLDIAKGYNRNEEEQDKQEDPDGRASSGSSGSSSSSSSTMQSSVAVIHWNDTHTRKTPPRIYTCTGSNANGMRESKHILASALPEFSFFDLSTTKAGTGRPKKRFPLEMLQPNYTNEYDIFVSTFSLDDCNPQHYSWLLRYFNGKFALFSGESEKDHPIQVIRRGDIMHAFGPLLSPRPHDFPLTYMQMTWWDIFCDTMLPPSAMTDPQKRPKGNNQTHYMIYANSNCVDFREEAIGRLSEFGMVHCDGKCQGMTPPIGNRSNLLRTRNGINVASWWRNVELYSKYRFCFVMEHERDHATYITEKIIMAFSAGCIPIYYGPKSIFDVFNRKAFVFYNISNPQPALDQVKAMEENKLLYKQMLEEPIVAHGERTIQEYFSFNDTIGNGFLKTRLREKLGITNVNFIP